MTGLSRRRFLSHLAGAGLCASLPRFATAANAYPFAEVPASASGITWKHNAGKSPQKYLPETTGAGCAFLDYDNDGWMDIYLVNSGKCDFYDPDPAPAQCALPQQSGRNFYRCDRESRRARRRLRHGCRRGRL